MPAVSIITINYNNAKGLEKTIQSVIEQNFTDFEFIIIDGGSSDESVEVIKKYESKISHWASEKDKGIYNAQNKGIKVAKGEYTLFLNSGDYLAEKDILKKVFYKKPTADIVYGNMYIVYSKDRMEKGYMPAELTFYHMIKNTLWHPVSFIKRSLFEKYGGYNEDYKIAADYDFFLNMLIVKKVSTEYLNEFISVFIHDGKSASADNIEVIKKERRQAQMQYFHPSIIALAEQYSNLYDEIPRTLRLKIKSLFKRP